MNGLARAVGVDPAYILRLEKDVHSPSRQVVLGIADALGLDGPERDRLLFKAGLAPTRDYQALYEALGQKQGGRHEFRD